LNLKDGAEPNGSRHRLEAAQDSKSRCRSLGLQIADWTLSLIPRPATKTATAPVACPPLRPGVRGQGCYARIAPVRSTPFVQLPLPDGLINGGLGSRQRCRRGIRLVNGRRSHGTRRFELLDQCAQ